MPAPALETLLLLALAVWLAARLLRWAGKAAFWGAVLVLLGALPAALYWSAVKAGAALALSLAVAVAQGLFRAAG